MTADRARLVQELLPLPWIERYAVVGDIAYPVSSEPDGDYVDYDDHVSAMHAYARSCVAAAIEGAGVEVERLQEYVREADRRVGEQFMAAQDADAHRLRVLNDRLHDVKRAEEAEARAERLEEALREIAEHRWTGVRPIQIKAKAALAASSADGEAT